jgi:hypothetical protein
VIVGLLTAASAWLWIFGFSGYFEVKSGPLARANV